MTKLTDYVGQRFPILWDVMDSFESAVAGAKQLWTAVNMISQVQTASASIGKPVSALKAFKILFGGK